ncbi:MAG TPA: hypothetical protein VK138_05330 [Acidiferrobacterales bacterium]|nr:hypothetical protein [Acidiferrobacterales bacterium]
MLPRIYVPQLKNKNLIIRLAKDKKEVEKANWLVYRNYVAEGFWEEDIEAFHNNKWFHSPYRKIFVVIDNDKVIGTASIILDSKEGLPSDSFQPEWIQYFRRTGDKLAEVSALAIDKSHAQQKNLILFLIKFYMQYSFYYTNVDRLIKACKQKHADFYASILRFQKVGGLTHNNYARRPSYLLTMHLLKGHALLSEYYASDATNKNNFYRFVLVDEHPNLIFPKKKFMRHSRQIDWPVRARMMDAAIAV